MKWHKIPGIENTLHPFIKKVKIGNKNICLVGYNNEVFALSAICPHAGADLSEGYCNGEQLVCAVHHYSYDIHTGKGNRGKHDHIDTFPVKIKEDGIYVGITSLWDKLMHGFQ